MFLPQLVHTIFFLFYIALLARVVFSWLPVTPRAAVLLSVRSLSYQITEPLLRPIRRLLAPYQAQASLDFSPVILYLILIAVESFLRRWL